MGTGRNGSARRLSGDGSPRPRGIVFRKGRGVRAAIVVASAKGRRRLGHGRGQRCTGLDQTRPPDRDAAATGMTCTVAPQGPCFRPAAQKGVVIKSAFSRRLRLIALAAAPTRNLNSACGPRATRRAECRFGVKPRIERGLTVGAGTPPT